MSSDPRMAAAQSALSAQRTVFRAVAISSLERIRMVLASSQGAERAKHQLGALGSAHIDTERFAELSHELTMDAGARAIIARAASVLTEIVNAPEREYVIDVPPGASPREAIEAEFARWGRVFGATAAAELARAARYDPAQHESLLGPRPFAQWTRAQRQTAPPAVLTLKGAGLQAQDLAVLLDGGAHIVLIVDGDCSPAPLVRLVTPGTLVLQTSDERGLDRFKAYTGPAIAAFVPETAAAFIHDPMNGPEMWQRITIWHTPDGPPRKAVGRWSTTQQQQELQQLFALAAAPSLPIAAVDALAPPAAWDGNATDRLASWLLAQTGDGTPR